MSFSDWINDTVDSSERQSAVVRSRPADAEGGLITDGGFAAETPIASGDLPHRGVSIGSMLSFKWTLLVVFLLVAIPSIAGIWLLMTPKFKARAQIRVRPIIPRLVFATDENGAIPFYDSFLRTQVSIMLSPDTLNRVLDDPEVRATQWYAGSQRVFGREESHMDRLLDDLDVGPVPRTEIINLNFRTKKRGDAVLILDKVLENYIRRTVEHARVLDKDLTDDLRNEHEALKAEVEAAAQAVTATKKELETSAPEDLVASIRLRVGEAENALTDTRQKIRALERRRDELQAAQRERFAAWVSELEEPELLVVAADVKGRIDRLTQRREELEVKETEKVESDSAQDTTASLDLRLKVLARNLAELVWRKEELSKHVSEEKLSDVASLPAPEPQPGMSFESYLQLRGDPEWQELKAAVIAAQFELEAAKRRLSERHPTLPRLQRNLEVAKAMLTEREKQLLPLVAIKPPSEAPITGQPDQTGQTGGEGELARIEAELSALEYRVQVEESHLKRGRERIREALIGSQRLQEQMRALAWKRELLKAVADRQEQRRIESNERREDPGSISVLSRPFAPSSPASDRRKIFSAMAFCGAMGLAVVAAYFRASRSQSMHAAEELPPPLRGPFLGQLPMVGRSEDLERSAPLLESTRMVRTALLSRIAAANGGSVVLITSAGTGTGKTTLTKLLGRSLADCGKSVLLVDGDMRKPSLTRSLGLSEKRGLLDDLRAPGRNGDSVYDTEHPKLSVMPAGRIEGDVEVELMANGVMSSRLRALRESYDIILLDGAPILPVADSRILSQHVDGTIMVVREDRCRRSEVVDAAAYLGFSGGKLLGTVYIGSDQRTRYYSDYYGYGAGRRKS